VAPNDDMSQVDKYVEAYVVEGLKRQLEQEENVVRSLPFFAGALTLVSVLIGSGHIPLCRPSSDWISVATWGFMLVTVSLLILGDLSSPLPLSCHGARLSWLCSGTAGALRRVGRN
jgi:hypothetical protein